jgi:hypothetical protein
MQTFLNAAEGIRTLDLLHGKQSMNLSWARAEGAAPLHGSLTISRAWPAG